MQTIPKEKLLGRFKLAIAAGGATAKPPLSSALGQRGINIMEFVKAFNDATKSSHYVAGAPYICYISFYDKKKFSFTLHNAPMMTYLIKDSFKIKGINADIFKRGDKKEKKEVPSITMTWDQLMDIAAKKIVDLHGDFKSAAKTVWGTCRSFNIIVPEEGLLQKLESLPNGVTSIPKGGF
jgi:large subunit ribosomal protein L11